MKDYWSEYWAQGYITSFGEDIKTNYSGKLKECWGNFSSTLNEDATILDIGTGNGALIDLINNSREHNFTFFAVDQAQLKEDLIKNLPGRFISNTSAENLPFKNEFFDAVVSQFAIEYSDLHASIKECGRVLKKGGSYQLICHEKDSDIVTPNIDILASAKRVKNRFLNELYQLITCIKKNDDILNEKINLIELFIKEENKINTYAFNATLFPSFYEFVLSNRKIDLDKAYSLFNKELEGLIFRLSDLENAAKNSSEILGYLNQYNLSVSSVKLIDKNKQFIGTLYQGHKL